MQLLTVRAPDGTLRRLQPGESMTIGRDAAVSDVAIDNKEISRRHVRIDAHDDGLTATDLGSTNGTSIVTAGYWRDLDALVPARLQAGDLLVVPDDIQLCEIVTIGSGS